MDVPDKMLSALRILSGIFLSVIVIRRELGSGGRGAGKSTVGGNKK